MSCDPRVKEWATTLQTHLPHLSKPQLLVLALWSLGMVLARSCALTAVSACLAPWLDGKANTLRQRLREFYSDAPAKRGQRRHARAAIQSVLPILSEREQGSHLRAHLSRSPPPPPWSLDCR